MTPPLSHPRAKDLLARLESALARKLFGPWEGDLFRFATPEFADPKKIISGEGGHLHPGRWLDAGVARVLYASVEPETATSEAFAAFRRAGLPLARATPRVMVAIEAKLEGILDLTTSPMREFFDLTLEELTDPDWKLERIRGKEPITQAFGRLAFQAGFEGLLVPSSAQKDAQNMVIFPDSLRAKSSLRVHP